MDYQSAKYQLQNNPIKPVYLFSGSEIGDKKEALSIIKSRVFDSEEETVFSFYCDSDFSLADFQDTVMTMGLFSPNKLILLKNIEQAKDSVTKLLSSMLIPVNVQSEVFHQYFINNKVLTGYYEEKNGLFSLKKIKEADKKKIVQAFSDVNYSPIPHGTHIILINETADKIPEAIVRLIPEKELVLFYEMFENKKVDWVILEFKKYKLQVDRETVDFLLTMVQNNKSELEREIRNIAIFLEEQSEKKTSITKEMIEDFLSHSKEETPFSLFSAIMQKDIPKSLSILEKLFCTDPHAILPGLLWSQKRLIRFFDLFENNRKSTDIVFREMFVTNKRAKDEFLIAKQNYSFHHAVHGLSMMAQLEYNLRFLPATLRLVKLQQLVICYVGDRIDKSFLQEDFQFLVC